MHAHAQPQLTGLAPAHTPMMAQYLSVKEQYPDTLVFYRMGDFYELFFKDAEIASRVLDITLTKRGKTDGTDIPMCGVPVHAMEPYLARLIRAGHCVAICEQVETPEQAKAQRGAKALVRRDVIRVVTPGTLTEDTLLNARAANYLAALSMKNGQPALAWVDISTGEFKTTALAPDQLGTTLAQIAPREILVATSVYAQPIYAQTLKLHDSAVTLQPDSLFDPGNADTRLKNHYNVKTLDSFGTFSVSEVSAAGTLLDYIERTQKAAILHLRTPEQLHARDVLHIDAATRRNLELTQTLSGDRRGSLLDTIDHTVTAGGARLLHARLNAPLRHLDTINDRLDQIEYFTAHASFTDALRTKLKSAPDMERALARLSLNRGSPRDLSAIQTGLAAIQAINHDLVQQSDAPLAIATLQHGLTQSGDAQALHDTLQQALADDLPALTSDGGFIRVGFDARLDHERDLRDGGRRRILELQQKYMNASGIDTLKITHNNILGYYIEVSAKRADALLSRPEMYIHRQTMANAVRFTTTELAELERALVTAAGHALAIELEIFGTLRDQVMAARDELTRLATTLSALDVATSLAFLARTQKYTRPVLTSNQDFTITGGRHPVVECALQAQSQPFIANDADLSPSQSLWLLTGPNMAGKSTFLRQNALIIILAQMGCYVPAAAATIGLVDRLFSRVGASDDLARGQSTFMVEMVETAAILNQATAHSFVILDEIGRGTATFDGLSIAWGCLEYLHDVIACRGLFATHYHELTTLQNTLPRLYPACMQVKEWEGDIIFLHAVAPGAAPGSYGVHVAKLAGLPPAVVARAGAILSELQAHPHQDKLATLPAFDASAGMMSAPPHPVVTTLNDLDLDTLSPRAALDILYDLKHRAR